MEMDDCNLPKIISDRNRICTFRLSDNNCIGLQVIIVISTNSMLANVPDYFSTEYENLVFARVDFGRFVANTSAAQGANSIGEEN